MCKSSSSDQLDNSRCLSRFQAACGREPVKKEEQRETRLEGGRPFNYCESLAMQHRMCMRQANLGALLIRKHDADTSKHRNNVPNLRASRRPVARYLARFTRALAGCKVIPVHEHDPLGVTATMRTLIHLLLHILYVQPYIF